jgi:gamma-glutamyltranspeptidase/glutathione hydrolase
MLPAFAPFVSRRSAVHSLHGMVACSQPLAAVAGQNILRQGGNAAVSCTFFHPPSKYYNAR